MVSFKLFPWTQLGFLAPLLPRELNLRSFDVHGGTGTSGVLLLLCALFFGRSMSLQPNTDEFYVYEFLRKTGGDVYVPSSSTSPASICPWRGVVCQATADGEHIARLTASGLKLRGPIPENTVGKLGELEHLDLRGNGLTGLPVDFWGLGGSLRTLLLSSNGFNGSLPGNIANLGKLERLDLSGNRFSGDIPAAIGELSSLTSLDLSGNEFLGSVQGVAFAWSNLGNLTHLNLARNRLRGDLPDFSELEHLVLVNLSGNLLRGPLAAALLPTKLQVLDLSSNRFKSSNSKNFSSLVSKLPGLEFLNLSGIKLDGAIPLEISGLLGLKTLDLSHNRLSGNVPDFIPEGLRLLDVSWNGLTGEILPSLRKKLLRMRKFDFSHNNLTVCSVEFPPEVLRSAFIGAAIECPVAVDPNWPPEGRRSGHRSTWKITLAMVLSAVFLLAGLAGIVVSCRRGGGRWVLEKMVSSREGRSHSGPFEVDKGTWAADVRFATTVPVVIFEKPLADFTFADLLSATSRFDRGTLLAYGRLGPVYRGILPGGIQVAVKVLLHSSMTDDEAIRELERLGSVRHPNLVSLTGYCVAGGRMIAMYEYMENGTLQSLLHDLPLENWEVQNTWRFRHRIAVGAARALAFLHHGCSPRIIHRDVKATSIFFDSEFEPRLSDFGLAEIVGGECASETLRVSPGYMAPELLGPGRFSMDAKSDVFAFGVVMFELVTGRRPIGDEYPEEKDGSLVEWARGVVRRSGMSAAIDARIRGTGPVEQMEEALRIGYLCTADEPSRRPSMQQVVGLLKDIEPGS